MTNAEVREKLDAREATLARMGACLDAIERRLSALESHGPGLAVGVGLGLALLMTVYQLF